MPEFYPNSCFICQSRDKLKRCSRCNMMSYCGKEHQLQHWPVHKQLCNEIASIIKEQGISHLYENLQGLDSQSWKLQVELLVDELEERLNRDVSSNELEALMFPRVCFVCQEARQELLRNCPDCPAASFCNKHLNSPLHNEDCKKMKKIHEMQIEADSVKQMFLLEAFVPIITDIKVDESSKLPRSMGEFLEQYVKPSEDFSENELIFLSDNCDVQLTIFNALEKLKYADSEIIVHIEGLRFPTVAVDTSSYWEILFHILPHLRDIKIIYVDADFIHEVEIVLCENCKSDKKKLKFESNNFIYLDYMKMKDYKEPDILVFLNVHPEILEDDLMISWQVKITRCLELNCPLVFTTNTEAEPTQLQKVLKSTLGNSEICYEGINEFGSLSFFRHWHMGICLPNHFLIVIDSTKTQKSSLISFYPSHCAVCFSEESSLACKNCKMIFYCGTAHRNKHLSQHRDVCAAVSEMLNDSGDQNIFETLKATKQESWLKAKIDLMLKVKSKLGRDLLEFEKEMFLFPKTCIVCHESDLKLLMTCECGVSCCKEHETDLKHKELCQDFSMAFEFSKIIEPPSLHGLIKAERGMTMPSSMEDFIASFYEFKDEDIEQSKFQLQKIILSNLLSRSLTLVFAMKKLKFLNDNEIVVHVIGATGMEVGTYAYWTPVFFLLECLEVLKIVFIGPEVFSSHYYLDMFFDECSCVQLQEDNLKVECHALRYEEYCKLDSFVQPNIVVGFNLNLHESELGITECTWKETILALKKVNVPFVLTAGTEDRAKKDHERFCELFGKSVDYVSLERNPFAGMIPERDFESEELLYSSQYVITYDIDKKQEEKN